MPRTPSQNNRYFHLEVFLPIKYKPESLVSVHRILWSSQNAELSCILCSTISHDVREERKGAYLVFHMQRFPFSWNSQLFLKPSSWRPSCLRQSLSSRRGPFSPLHACSIFLQRGRPGYAKRRAVLRNHFPSCSHLKELLPSSTSHPSHIVPYMGLCKVCDAWSPWVDIQRWTRS